MPFIVETGGRNNAAGLEFFDTVSGALEGDTAKVRAARRAALYTCTMVWGRRRVGQAAGLPWYTQIVAEIHAPDLAVGWLGSMIHLEDFGAAGGTQCIYLIATLPW